VHAPLITTDISVSERGHALSLLHEIFAGSVTNRPGLVILEGAVGCGKTDVMLAFAEHVTGEGAVLLSTMCSRLERDRQFGVVRELLDGVEPLLRTDSAAMRRLDENTLVPMMYGPDSAEIQMVAGQVHNDFFSVVHALSEQQPVAVCIDDVQHLDVSSARCLLYAVRRLRSSRVTMVVSYSSATEPVASFFNHELFRMPQCQSVRLGLLSRAGVRQLLASGLGEVTDQVVADTHAATGGNPLLVRAVMADCRESGAPAGGSPVLGKHVQRAVLGVLHWTSESTLEVARGIAVLDAAGSPTLLARLLDLELAVVRRELAVLDAVGLVSGNRFRHRSAAVAVREEAAPGRWTALHLRAAELLHEDGAPPMVLAEHLIVAGSAHPVWALDVLQEAARKALADGEAQFAEQCLKLATWACADDGRRLTSKAMLLELAWRVDPSGADRHVPYLMNALKHGRLTAESILSLTKYLLWHGQITDAAGALTKLAELAPTVPLPTAVAIESLRMSLYHAYPPLARLLSQGPSRDSDRPPAPLQVADAQYRAARILAEVLGNRAGRTAATEVKHLLQGTSTAEPTFETTRCGLLALLYLDEIGETIRHCDALLAEALRTDTCYAMLQAIRAEAVLRCGNITAARRLAESAMTTVPIRGWGVVAGLPMSTLLKATVALGDLAAAADLLDQPMPVALSQSRHGLTYLYARGRYHLAAGAPTAALEDFIHCGELMQAWNVDMPTMVPWRSGAAEAHLAISDLATARTLLEKQLTLVGSNYPRAHGITLRLLALTEKHAAHKREILEPAVELLDACGDRYELAQALLELASVYGALGEPRRARINTQMAVSAVKHYEITLPLQSKGDVLPEPSAEKLSILTHAERRVAVLAARGHINREIAEKLFITTSTVEQHLTRVFRKLAIRRREDLPTSLGGVRAPWSCTCCGNQPRCEDHHD
jgi:DNA-binding CsgD family transcriptional regulator